VLQVETGRTIGTFIFEEILCCWGAVSEIVTDNGSAYVAALDWLADKYGICHIQISAYNSRANSVVEQQHRTIRDSLVKACSRDISKWPAHAPHVFWADCVTMRRSTEFSPFYMAHSVEPILLFDLALTTFLIPDLTEPLPTAELIATCARQLKKQPKDLATIHNKILKSQFTLIKQFKKHYQQTIYDYDFQPGDLVLIHNSSVDSDIGSKMAPHYLGPMLVLRWTCNGAYRLAELDGAISWLHYAAFHLILYHAHSPSFIPVTHIVGHDELLSLLVDDHPPSFDRQFPAAMMTGVNQGWSNLNPPGGVRSGDPLGSETSTLSTSQPAFPDSSEPGSWNHLVT